jgi:hypothetical protein
MLLVQVFGSGGSSGSGEWRPSIILPGAASDMMEESGR